jgi:hypothetical protein
MGQFDRISGRGRLPTVATAPPPGAVATSGGRPGIVSQLSGEIDDVMQGRLSLVMLNTITIGLIGFYLWTRRAQGGG